MGIYDCLYVSPHSWDVPDSCAGRLAWEASRGLRVLIVTLFGGGQGSSSPADVLGLGLPAAPSRDPVYASRRGLLHDRRPIDDEILTEAARRLDEIAGRTKVRRIYLPLGVDGHVDHRLGFDAGLAAFQSAAGRDVLFYEERPQALVAGAVWLRLGQLGVRLPPAAAQAARRASLPRLLLRLPRVGCTPVDAAPWSDGISCLGLLARDWWRARSWRPLKALGPRLQPVLGEAGASERCWLLLPPREDVIALHAVEPEASLPGFSGSGH
jgi:LmbE family N-acetylglucosaminyl deacetylase